LVTTIDKEMGLMKEQKSNPVPSRRLRGIKTRFKLLTLKSRANKTLVIKTIKDHKWRVKNLIQMPKILKIWKWNRTSAEVLRTTKRADLAALEMMKKTAAAIRSPDLSRLSTAAAKTKYLEKRNWKIQLNRMQT
jgi:hypothetical protein